MEGMEGREGQREGGMEGVCISDSHKPVIKFVVKDPVPTFLQQTIYFHQTLVSLVTSGHWYTFQHVYLLQNVFFKMYFDPRGHR